MQKMPPECGVCLGLNTVEDEKQLYYCEAENCKVIVHPGTYAYSDNIKLIQLNKTDFH